MKNILVVGSNGFIGRNICNLLISNGYHVHGLDIQSTSAHDLYSEYSQFDVLKDSFSSLLSGIDCVIYLVSTLLPQPSNVNVVRDVNENLLPVISLLECIKESSTCNKIIFASSGGTIYGAHSEPVNEVSYLDPKCSYGIMKLTVEKYLKLYSSLYDIQTVSLRLSNPYGIGQDLNKPQGAVGIFLNNILNDKNITIWGDGSVIRDYIHVDDVASAFMSAIKYEGESDIFNIGSGIGTSLNELLTILEDVTGKAAVIEYTESRSVDVPINVLDIEKANIQLDWRPTVDLKLGLKSLYDINIKRS
ncbi:NAD-dependent epimerase/dehydratase family protein [Buttiauxella sp. WJP83]|uniref:NAD-dependent epimerase/dehydratase family protein n=1 Tax=Buttiauxella sp. WJP83 TaxID=2986951 RepID=UPI0022DE03E3|nr:NAD-dependent epimerase/dehydratase family protein [Buttiauxella sp. WJP83]WBM72086.1 NAD-dependent epimerase/dehydratase family protein [Buttiauxella sp. WJP83]